MTTTTIQLKTIIHNLLGYYKDRQLILKHTKKQCVDVMQYMNQIKKKVGEEIDQISSLVHKQLLNKELGFDQTIVLMCNIFTINKSNSYNLDIKQAVFKGFESYLIIKISDEKYSEQQKMKERALKYYSLIDLSLLLQYITLFYHPDYVKSNKQQLIKKAKQYLVSDKATEFLSGLKIVTGFRLQPYLNDLQIDKIIKNRLKFKIDSYIFFFEMNRNNIIRIFLKYEEYKNKQSSKQNTETIKSVTYICDKLLFIFPQIDQHLNVKQLETYTRVKDILSRKLYYYFFLKHPFEFVQTKYLETHKALIQFSRFLIRQKRYDEAYSLIKRHNLPGLQELQKQSKNLKIIPNLLIQNDTFGPTQSAVLKHLKDDIQYLSLPNDFGIRQSDVKFINDTRSFSEVKQQILHSNILSFDCQTTQMNHLQTIQLATQSKIFILDVPALKQQHTFNKFAHTIFCQNNHQKLLGFSPSNDKKSIRKCLDIQKNWKPCIDIEQIQNTSLSKLAFKYFGKHLSKYQQMSSWQFRPLRKAQLHYGALDAFLLLRLFKLLKK